MARAACTALNRSENSSEGEIVPKCQPNCLILWNNAIGVAQLAAEWRRRAERERLRSATAPPKPRR
jgi:hypothetical protein